jgi:hypothetical protein
MQILNSPTTRCQSGPDPVALRKERCGERKICLLNYTNIASVGVKFLEVFFFVLVAGFCDQLLFLGFLGHEVVERFELGWYLQRRKG